VGEINSIVRSLFDGSEAAMSVRIAGDCAEHDEDGGEELPVPPISQAALARMQPATTAVQR
jgi:hypothetical protein